MNSNHGIGKAYKETSYLEKQKKNKILILTIAIIGIILVVLSYIQNTSTKENSQQNIDGNTFELEKRLAHMIKSATGGKSVDVLITLDETKETVYESSGNLTDMTIFNAAETDTTHELTAKYSHLSQEIKGVMIVCKGLTEKSDFDTIKRAVSTALGINENQIYIIGGTS